MKSSDKKYEDLLLALQKGLPLDERPFAVLGERLGLSEDEIIAVIRQWFDDGTARRLGAIFDARRLGYKSALCCLSLGNGRTDAIVPLIAEHPGVTHCYLRGWPEELDTSAPGGHGDDKYPNIWFTLAVPADEFDSNANMIRDFSKPDELIVLPAVRRFKIDVIFDPDNRDKGERFPGAPATNKPDHNEEQFHEFTEKEKAVVRILNDNLQLSRTPFRMVAENTGYLPGELIDLLRSWTEKGILRRIALILYHRKIGFKANAMCAWSVPDGRILEAGRSIASNREVTHCYQRIVHPVFPFNLYAMIHTMDWQATSRLFERIAADAGLDDGRMLCSIKEFKKTSMKYF